MRTLIGLLAAVALAAPGRAGALQWGLSAEVAVVRFGAGVVTRVAGGPSLAIWDVDGVSRTRVGARGAVAFDWPLSERCTGSLRATAVASGSVMNRGETPPGVDRRTTRRGGVSVGLRYRL